MKISILLKGAKTSVGPTRMGLGNLQGNLWQENAALTSELVRRDSLLKQKLFPAPLSSSWNVEAREQWPEQWKQWNKMLQNAINSICQIGSGVRITDLKNTLTLLFFTALFLLFLTGSLVEVKMCGNGDIFHWSKCNLSVRRQNISFHGKTKNLGNIPYKSNFFT